MSDYNLIIDTQNRRLVADFLSTEAGIAPDCVFGDKPTVNVQLVKSNSNDADQPWQADGDLTGQTIRVGVGSLADDTPSAYIELTDDLAAASAVVTEVRAGVLNTTNEIQRVEILDAVSGNYTLTIAGETTTPLDLDASSTCIKDAVEALASITADSVSISGNPLAYNLEFDSSLADVGAITVNLDNVTSRVGKTGTLDLHVNEILTLLDGGTSVDATLEIVRWTTADVAGETVLQVPVTVRQDVIPDTVPGTTPLPGYATIDLDHINQSGAVTGQIPQWNGTTWVAATVAGSGDLLSTANLSDLADIPTARTNLGLGTAATTDATDYATAAQGTTADSALQAADIDTLAELNAIVGDATLIDTTDSRLSDARTPTAHTHTAADIDAGASADGYVLTSDGAGNAAWEASSGGAGHDPVTVTDSAEIDFTLVGQDITASIVTGSIDETKLDASTNASLDLADSASQPGHTHTSSEITNNTSESTGVLTGGVLSTGAGAAQFSISDGTGQIVTEAGAMTMVSWSGKTNITPTNIATSLLTWVGINSSGNVVEKTSAFTPNEIRNTIFLGVIVHTDNVNVQTVNNQQVDAANPLSTAYDIADAIGFVNKSGNEFTANGANLNINKSAGVMFKIGSNYDVDTGNPHNKTLAALTPVTFEYRYSDGSSQAPWLTTIDPNNLDDGAGGNTAVGNNRWSVQRIYSFVSNNVKLQRGVEDFATKAAAIEGITSEAYVTEPSIAANGLLRGWLVVKQGATDLSDPGEAQFINAPKFGESAAGGASTPPGDASVVLIEALKATAGTITAGSVVRTTGYNGTRVLVELADADAAGETPGLGIARDDITDAIAGNVVVFGKLAGIDTSSFSVADTLYLSTTPGGLTNTKPTGATTGIQAIARVLDVDASNGIVEVVGAGRTNDLPNLAVDGFWYGDSNGQPAEGTATAFGRSLLDDADAATARTTLDAQEDISGATITSATVSGTDKVLIQDTDDSDNLKTVTAQSIADLGGGGGGGLTQVTGTDADTAMAVGNMYVVDMSAWATADRVYSLPSTAAVGDQVGITIKTGDDTYTVDIQTTAASNDTINGVDHDSTPWSKLFQTGETVIMECVTANTDWVVVTDGRCPCAARIHRDDTAGAQTLTTSTFTKIQFTEETFNRGLTTDTSSNYRITVRRAGIYKVFGVWHMDGAIGSGNALLSSLYVDGSRYNTAWHKTMAGSSDEHSIPVLDTLDLNADSYVELYGFQASGANRDTWANVLAPNYLIVEEIL